MQGPCQDLGPFNDSAQPVRLGISHACNCTSADLGCAAVLGMLFHEAAVCCTCWRACTPQVSTVQWSECVPHVVAYHSLCLQVLDHKEALASISNEAVQVAALEEMLTGVADK